VSPSQGKVALNSENEIRVPDIGDFTDVPVIEIHVSPGDEIAPEDPLVTLESDKATMDVPSPLEGVVKQLRVNIGDRVSEGSVLLVAEGDSAGPARDEPEETPEEETRVEREPAPPDDEAGDGEPDGEDHPGTAHAAPCKTTVLQSVISSTA